MRRVSPRRAAALRIYTKIRREFLEANPSCIRCGVAATEVHHAAGRIGRLLTDVGNFRAMCHDCHVHATLHPAEAVEQGWSLPRIGGAA